MKTRGNQKITHVIAQPAKDWQLVAGRAADINLSPRSEPRSKSETKRCLRLDRSGPPEPLSVFVPVSSFHFTRFGIGARFFVREITSWHPANPTGNFLWEPLTVPRLLPKRSSDLPKECFRKSNDYLLNSEGRESGERLIERVPVLNTR